MELPQEATLLRVFIGESDRHEHAPLYEAIVLKAREMQMAGATVFRGPMGFWSRKNSYRQRCSRGSMSRADCVVGRIPAPHRGAATGATAKILRLSMALPIVIEIIDSEENIQRFLPVLDGMIGGGLVTLERVRALHYRSHVQG